MRALHEYSFAETLCFGNLRVVRSIIADFVGDEAHRLSGTPRLLDVGCWDGDATARYRDIIAARVGGGCDAAGIEIFDGPAKAAEARGVMVARIDLEMGKFPFEDDSFDIVVCNQVLEHLKNIWWTLSEIYRCLKPGGTLIVSVPNLASLHNRILLAFGAQPTSIRTQGPHVRGYTLREFTSLLELDGALRVERVRGVGFYPLPGTWANPLARLWRGASHTPVWLARKQGDRTIDPWTEYRRREEESGVQTHYS